MGKPLQRMLRAGACALLVSSAIFGGCAVTSTGDVQRVDSFGGTTRGAYPGCPPDSYFPNANCYGGPP
jgi:hypothetical protein